MTTILTAREKSLANMKRQIAANAPPHERTSIEVSFRDGSAVTAKASTDPVRMMRADMMRRVGNREHLA